MAIKKYRPTSPGRRFQTVVKTDNLTKKKPHKPLVAPMKKSGGRNNTGSITLWHRGGGHKRRYRIIDFKRDKHNIPAKVESIEYDPNRSARIALVCYLDGERRYILAPEGLQIGGKVMSGEKAEIEVGNALPIRNIPLGSTIHNIELKKQKGGQLVRSAGGSAQLIAKEGAYAHVRLPSREVRLINMDCYATLGQVGNVEHENISVGKAGRNRWMGWRPVVRGVAMNPVDHPMGGGEGRSSGGRHPCTPWGVPTKGYKTVRRKASEKYIVRHRSKK